MTNSVLVQTDGSSSFYEQVIIPAVRFMQKASGLSELAAKTCVYYAIATYGLKKLDKFPLLVISGATGTGKTSAMKALKQLVNNPIWFGTDLSPARLRDELKRAKDVTAFIEEGDRVIEELISNRFSRDTAQTSINRATENTVFHPESLEYFGATVLHKRKSFNDPATANRSIIVKTRYQSGNYSISQVDDKFRHQLSLIWEQVFTIYGVFESSNRVEDTWKPLLAAAKVCEDTEWIDHANKEMEKAARRLRLGQEFEQEPMILNALIVFSYQKGTASLMEIREHLRKEYGWQPSAWAVADKVRDLGFEVKKSHGQQKVVIDKMILADKCREYDMEYDPSDVPNIIEQLPIPGRD